MQYTRVDYGAPLVLFSSTSIFVSLSCTPCFLVLPIAHEEFTEAHLCLTRCSDSTQIELLTQPFVCTDLKFDVRSKKSAKEGNCAHTSGDAVERVLPELSVSVNTSKKMEVEGEGVHQCDKELIGQATENATNGVEGAEEGTSVLLAASDEVGSDKVLNRTVVNEKEGTLQTDSSNGADQGSANCVLGDDITVSHSDVPNSREGSVETACAHNLGRRINESQDEAVRISGIAADADVGTVLDDHPGDDEQPLKFLSVGILERADTPQQVDQCAAEITCECGKLARINVEGSNSENRGLRYLTCASSDLKHASRKRKRTDMEGCKFFQ